MDVLDKNGNPVSNNNEILLRARVTGVDAETGIITVRASVPVEGADDPEVIADSRFFELA